MKWKVSWWIHGAGRICRGSDIVEAEELSEDDAEDMIEADLSKNLKYWRLRHKPRPIGSKEEKPFSPNLPKFYEKHQDLMLSHIGVSNFGVLSIKKLHPSKGSD